MMTGRYVPAVLVFLITVSSFAQNNRSFVSTTGSDLNTCALGNPCRTFQHAITVTNAGGEIIAIDSGGYGPFTIDRSVSVQAAPGVYAGITATAGKGIMVIVNPTDAVAIRGLTVNGIGGDAGITAFVPVGALHVENCVINGFNNSGIGIGAAGKFAIKDTTVRECGGGINVGTVGPTPTGEIDVLVDGCRVERTRIGGAVNANNETVLTVRNTVAASNQIGFSAGPASAGRSAEMDVENCLVFDTASNGISAFAFAGTNGAVTMRVSNTFVTRSGGSGFYAESGTVFESFGNNKVRGNGPPETTGTITTVPQS